MISWVIIHCAKCSFNKKSIYNSNSCLSFLAHLNQRPKDSVNDRHINRQTDAYGPILCRLLLGQESIKNMNYSSRKSHEIIIADIHEHSTHFINHNIYLQLKLRRELVNVKLHSENLEFPIVYIHVYHRNFERLTKRNKSIQLRKYAGHNRVFSSFYLYLRILGNVSKSWHHRLTISWSDNRLRPGRTASADWFTHKIMYIGPTNPITVRTIPQ